jgi:FMN phosphatase YigB (HAD superfamily)
LRAVLFDVGGVLLRLDGLRPRVEAVFAGAAWEDFWRVFNEACIPVCRGEEPLSCCWKRVASQLGLNIPDEVLESLWIDGFADSVEIDRAVLEIAAQLSRRYRVGIVSNTFSEHSAVVAKMGVYRGFSPVILSHEVGCAKDEPRIFEIALQQLALPAEEVAFVDDVPKNAACAERLGLKALVFTSVAALRRDLRELGFEI